MCEFTRPTVVVEYGSDLRIPSLYHYRKVESISRRKHRRAYRVFLVSNQAENTIQAIRKLNRIFKLLLGIIFLSISNVSAKAQEDTINFETADKRFSVNGEIVKFIMDGKQIDRPQKLAPKLSIVIRKKDGTYTKPVPISQLSAATVKAICDSHGIDSLEASEVSLKSTEVEQTVKVPKRLPILIKDESFQMHFEMLEDLYQLYKRGPGQDPANFNILLNREISRIRSKVGDSKYPGVFGFVLCYIESDVGINRTVKLTNIAKLHEGHWPAWQTAIASHIRYQGCARISPLLTQFKAELITYCRQRIGEPESENSSFELEEAAEAIVWFQDTCKTISESNITNSIVIKNLSQDTQLAEIGASIKQFNEKKLEIAGRRAQEAAKREALKREETASLTLTAKSLLASWRENYNSIWLDGYNRFVSQNESFQKAYQEQSVAQNQHSAIAADRRLLNLELNRTKNDVAAARSSLEFDQRKLDEADRALTLAQAKLNAAKTLQEKNTANHEISQAKLAGGNARVGVSFQKSELEQAQNRYSLCESKYGEISVQERIAQQRANQLHLVAKVEYEKLSVIYQQLASFVNDAKNLAILFENKFKASLEEDASLRSEWVSFTDQLKVILGQFPVMPTIAAPVKSEQDKKAETLDEIYRLVRIDLDVFFESLRKE
jgi:hypothetical protein